MKKKLCSFIFLLLTLSIYAENHPYTIWGYVADSFTREALTYTNITVMDLDSIFISGGQSQDMKNQDASLGSQFNVGIPKSGEYLIRFSFIGYETLYVRKKVHVSKRQQSYNLGRIILRQSPKELSELKVTATKIKMVLKGDTVVYNADAFQLSQGSMLDQLIRQLPGVELREDGQILVNGRFVSSLLVNGEDFFRGDPKIALDNLPAYMVDKVKIYERQSEESRVLGIEDNREKPLVVDVNLKRQYSIGWIANAEAGGGTKERYLGRLFGLRFTDHSRLALFSNINNINDTRQPGTSGNWTPQGSATGLLASKVAGAELLINDKYKRYKIQSSTRVEHSDIDNCTKTSGTTFLTGGDTYSRTRNTSIGCNTKVFTRNEFYFTSKQNFFYFIPQVEYQKYRTRFQGFSATFSSQPWEENQGAALDSLFFGDPNTVNLLRTTLNSRRLEEVGDGHKLNTYIGAYGSMRLSDNNPDIIKIGANFRYGDESNHLFSQDDLRYLNNTERANDYRNQYYNRPLKYYNYDFTGEYSYRLIGYSTLNTSYTYKQSYQSEDRALYRLDNYDNWGLDTHHSLGKLPSTNDSLQACVDRRNSYESARKDNSHLVKLNLHLSKNINGGNWQLDFNFPLRIERNHLDYSRNLQDTAFSRHLTFFEPSISFNMINDKFRKRYYFTYAYTAYAPNMTYLLSIRDDSNPLSVTLGNPNIENSQRHQIFLSYSFNDQPTQKYFSCNLNYYLFLNSLCQSMTYDKTTGISTFRPENINGNWESTGEIRYSTPLDKKKLITFSTHTWTGYYHNVDKVSVNESLANTRSSVGSLHLSETLQANYRFSNYFQSGIKGTYKWIHANSSRTDFEKINCSEFNYGLIAQLELPYNIQISTDMTMFSRRGYADRNMNTDEFVWNGRISKSVYHGNLIFMLDGFDILGNLSNVRRTLNAQGRTESYNNVIPQYAMLHAIYRLNIQPKKKQ